MGAKGNAESLLACAALVYWIKLDEAATQEAKKEVIKLLKRCKRCKHRRECPEFHQLVKNKS